MIIAIISKEFFLKSLFEFNVQIKNKNLNHHHHDVRYNSNEKLFISEVNGAMAIH